jgi:hypothetical protein
MIFLYHKNLNFSIPWQGPNPPSAFASGGQKPFREKVSGLPKAFYYERERRKKNSQFYFHFFTSILEIYILFVLCITMLKTLVFIPRFFLRHLRIPAAIIG